VLACDEPPVERILVEPVPAILTIDRDSVVLLEGTSHRLSATLRDSSGIALEGPVSWLSYPPEIAAVDRTGLVRAHQMGTALVVARSGELTDTAHIDVRVRFRSVSAGQSHTCAVTAIGRVYCWGYNREGQLGTGTMGTRTGPTRVASGLTFATVSAGLDFTCAAGGAAPHCWGANRSGQLGTAARSDATTPAPVAGDLSAIAVSAYAIHACGWSPPSDTETGVAHCWGADWAGQLGDGAEVPGYGPQAIRGERQFGALAVGRLFTCGLTVGGEVYCWGANTTGQLGRSDAPETCLYPRGRSFPCSSAPLAVPATNTFAVLGAGAQHACAVGIDDSTYCWGDNTSGQLGVGSTSAHLQPTTVAGGLEFTALALGDRHTCGLTPDGAAYCWGANESGALGTTATYENCGSRLCSTVPVRAAPGHLFVQLSASRGGNGAHTCGLTTDGVLLCWGRNEWGQLGAGFQGGISFEPLRVSGQP
jgi:alpha-tubulin suppressor-like RCC1 family protein